MMTLMYFIGFFLIGVSFVSFVYFVRNINRKSMSKGWKVGDVVILNISETSRNLINHMNKNNIVTVTLCGWNEDDVFYNTGKAIYRESWKSINTNKSQVWRDHVSKCTEFMGDKPGFSSHVESKKPNESSGTIDGEPIETMNEIMCQIHLKKAIEEENYELADKLRKRLENFR